jgi:hypothetical protein
MQAAVHTCATLDVMPSPGRVFQELERHQSPELAKSPRSLS